MRDPDEDPDDEPDTDDPDDDQDDYDEPRRGGSYAGVADLALLGAMGAVAWWLTRKPTPMTGVGPGGSVAKTLLGK